MLGGSEYRDKLGFIKPGTHVLVPAGVQHQLRHWRTTARNEPCIILGHYRAESITVSKENYQARPDRRILLLVELLGEKYIILELLIACFVSIVND